jgi:hypothetical protein
MNSINANLPIINMPQVSAHQAEAQRAPVVHQAQNADIARDQADLRLKTAQEAEAAEGKIVNPKDKREEGRRGRRGNQDRQQDDGDGEDENGPSGAVAVVMTDTGRLIDLEA